MQSTVYKITSCETMLVSLIIIYYNQKFPVYIGILCGSDIVLKIAYAIL